MAHQSGIGVSVELQQFISDCRDSLIRSFKIVITDERMELGGKTEVKQNFKNDYNCAVSPFLESKIPCYVMVRYDKKNSQNFYEWLFIAYSPDTALVRDKMTYASTRTAFKRIFGRDLIVDELFGTNAKDVLYEGYLGHIKAKQAPAPLTDMEQIVLDAKEADKNYSALDSTDVGLPSLSLPYEDNVMPAFKKFSEGSVNYLQLSINMNDENLKLEHAKTVNISEISALTPESEPRFHFFNFSYNYESSDLSCKLFLYYVPGFKSSIKQRMIYSTFKSTLIQSYEKLYGPLARKIELSDMSEFTEEFLILELHPLKTETKALFNKPRKPGRS